MIARFDERQAALPVMRRIHEETEETVYLCVRRGREAVCIERLDGLWVQSMALRLGGSLDPNKVEAMYKNGLLLLTMPKAEHARPRQVQVQVASSAAGQS